MKKLGIPDALIRIGSKINCTIIVKVSDRMDEGSNFELNVIRRTVL